MVCTAARVILLGILAVGTPERAKAEDRGPGTFDFGKVQTGVEVRHALVIQNRNKGEPMGIQAVDSSCRDVQVISHPGSLAPGETGKLVVRWIPLDPGPLSCEIAVETRGSSAARPRFTLKGSADGAPAPDTGGLRSSGIPARWITRVPRPRDPSLVVSVESLHRDMERSAPVRVMDVRSQEAYAAFRIPGSLNVPLHALRTREFLKLTPVVVTGEGSEYASLEPECRKLRELGFRVWILEGGVEGWAREGHAVDGAATGGRSLGTMTPRQFFEERHLENWVILNACRVKSETGRYLVPQAELLPSLDDIGEAAARLSHLASRRKAGSCPSFLVFDDDGSEAGRIARALEGTGFGDVVFLEGGIEGYRRFLEDQAAFVRAQAHAGGEVTAPCPGCPQTP